MIFVVVLVACLARFYITGKKIIIMGNRTAIKNTDIDY